MKEVMHYACEVCGEEYYTKYECARCEKAHRIPIKFIGSKYYPFDNLPDTISIEFDDGNVCAYHRHHG